MTETKHKEHITSEHFGIPAEFADRAENYAAWRVQALSEQLAEAQALIEASREHDYVEMPEPVGTICFDGGIWEQNWVSSESAYSESQLKQYCDDRAREALEMAAKVSDKFKQPSQTKTTRVLAALISHDIRTLAKEIK